VVVVVSIVDTDFVSSVFGGRYDVGHELVCEDVDECSFIGGCMVRGKKRIKTLSLWFL